MPESSGGNTARYPNGSGKTSGTKKKKKASSEYVRGSTYPGKVEALKGYVYDVGYNARDQFSRTTKEIGEYIARTYKDAGEFINAFDPSNLRFVPIQFPPDPDARQHSS